MEKNPVVHFEIGCRNIQQTSAFYTSIFGWSPIPSGPAVYIDTNSAEGIQGHIASLGHEPYNYTTFYIQVTDIPAYLQKITEAGGKKIVGPITLPTGQQFAWFNDPAGNFVGLLTKPKPPAAAIKRATGIGGVFLTCDDPKKQKEWYAKHLGVPENGVFEWREKEDPDRVAKSSMAFFKKGTSYFKPSEKDFMINYRVENLAALLEQLKQEGVQIVGEMQVYDYGKFGWIIDPEGNKIELWEPIG